MSRSKAKFHQYFVRVFCKITEIRGEIDFDWINEKNKINKILSKLAGMSDMGAESVA